jgi:apolipoprotein N-acyltransferase
VTDPADKTPARPDERPPVEGTPVGEVAEEAAAEPRPDELRYARLLRPGAVVALAILAVTFTIYLTGLRRAHVPPGEMDRYWSMPTEEYLREVGLRPGWAWTSRAHLADYANYFGIYLLAALPAIAYASLLPIFLKRRQWVLAGIVLVQLAIMAVAASGILVR